MGRGGSWRAGLRRRRGRRKRRRMRRERLSGRTGR